MTSFQIITSKKAYPNALIWQVMQTWPTHSHRPQHSHLNAVAIQSPNSLAYILRMLTLWHRQALVMPLDPKIPSAEVEQLLSNEGFPPCETEAILNADLATATLQSESNASLEKSQQPPQALMPLNQPASLIRTSGSSAYPKLAQHSWGNHVYSAQGSLQHLPLGTKDRWLLSLPLYHVGGLAILVRCWLAGATLAIPDPEQSLAEAIVCFEPTHLSLVPTQLIRLLDNPKTHRLLKQCKAILLGGAPMSADLLKKAQLAELKIHTSYGSTEMSSQITTSPPDYWQQASHPPVVSGSLLPHRELQLHNGEVQVRGQTLFQGYRQCKALHLPLENGWFATGDLGQWHKGQLLITGRKDYQFISGGENIQPEEIERYLLSFSEIKEAMVVPISDPEFGERPVAILRLEQNIEATLFFKALPSLLRPHLPKFKIPLAFYLWPDHLQGTGLKPRRKDFQNYAQALYHTE